MRVIKFILPFILILVIYLFLPHFLANVSKINVMSFNEPANGLEILLARRAFNTARFDRNCSILFIGTSRTMAGYDASFFADKIAIAEKLDASPCSINLGNLGNSPRALEQFVTNYDLQPDLLILEFSPHIFFGVQEFEQTESDFDLYQLSKQVYELRVEKFFSTFSSAAIKLDPAFLYTFFSKSNIENAGNLYPYLVINSFGLGQKLQPDGQVLYHSYLPNAGTTQEVARFLDNTLNNFVRDYSFATFNEYEWEAFLNICKEFGARRIVVVRPPVAPDLYDFENDALWIAVERIVPELGLLGIEYVDMNPNTYSSLDFSHVDWYDTQKLTFDLFTKLEPWLRNNYFRR